MRLNSDGTPLYVSDLDERNEDAVRTRLEQAWKCEIRHFGLLSVVDFYALRHGRIAAVLELKTRTHEAHRYPDVFLAFRKWIALKMARLAHGCAALFVVQFADRLMYVDVSTVHVHDLEMGGSHTEREPVFRVPIDHMQEVNYEKTHRPVPETRHLADPQDDTDWL